MTTRHRFRNGKYRLELRERDSARLGRHASRRIDGDLEEVASMKRPQLKSLRVMSGLRLRLTFRDERSWIVKFDELIAESPGLSPLREDSAFRRLRLSEGGWGIEWPELDIQIGADTLWLDAQAQNADDENTRTFARWRARHGLSLAQAAQALGVSTRTLSAYGTGKRPVPRYMALACSGWEAEQRKQASGPAPRRRAGVRSTKHAA